MPQTLNISDSPSPGSIKRQRSQEQPSNDSGPASSGRVPSNGGADEPHVSIKELSVKIPAYLNKNRERKCSPFIAVALDVPLVECVD
jgi:hypothetical protein